MSPEERELLDRSVELAEENNKMLHALRRSARISRFISIVYWVLIIGSTVGAYYLIQPYINQLYGVYSGAQSDLSDVNSILQGLKNQSN